MDHLIPVISVSSGKGEEVAQDLYCFTVQVVNVCFVGSPGPNNEWVLVDAGMPKSDKTISSAAEKRFGPGCKPKAIILTHGHFDHVGAVEELAEQWDAPVYAHERELPFLTGQTSYPEPDPTVEGGLVAKISRIFPNEPVNLGARVQQLPADGSVPGMPDWRWIHTPGHAPGHISLFRQRDRVLLAGDAFVTVRQDSLYKVLIQQQEVNGPPRYFTTDWQAAWDSVKQLHALNPEKVVTGHGPPMSGVALSEGLDKLVNEFDQLAIPDYGRYVDSRG